jgi:two-component system response regulator RegA
MTEAPCILVLDDDPVFTGILVKALTRRGYRTLEANDIATALRHAADTVVDHAVVDLKIAQESGLDVLQPLLAANAEMQILILTGYSSIATAVSAIKSGARDYACKPLDADEILQKLGLQQAPEAEPAIPEQPVSVDRLEWEHIQRVLTENDGNISATARSLGMHRRTLQRKLQKRPVRR